MRISTVRSEGLAHLSYCLSSQGEAVVIDPRRDAGIYRKISVRTKSEIRYILETHRNEDYVTGSLELQHLVPSARICHSGETAFRFGENLSDGDTLRVGKMAITCIWTPGHTIDSMCYALSDSQNGVDPIALFTGDTLFVNEVGRTDLAGPQELEQMTMKLYDSLHQKVVPLGDGVVVYPGHGAGSVCGGEIGERDFTTIGYERSHNPWLACDRRQFTRRKVKQVLTLASYFKHCEQLNTEGPPLSTSLARPEPLDPDAFETKMRLPDHIIVDTRPKGAFVGSHIPGGVSLSLSNMGLISGWVLSPTDKILLVADRPQDLVTARRYLMRIGYDNIVGFLNAGMASWESRGKPTQSMRVYTVPELHDLSRAGRVRIIDIRQEHEQEKEYIEGALKMPLTSLRERMSEIDADAQVATMCPSGIRATTAASILQRGGLTGVAVPATGLKTWKELGYPTKQKSGSEE